MIDLTKTKLVEDSDEVLELSLDADDEDGRVASQWKTLLLASSSGHFHFAFPVTRIAYANTWDDDLLDAAAERLALCWNAFEGIPTDQIADTIARARGGAA